eukprot:TRINITY_DN232_c0_g1_i2.p2 TRINITY_DN232_c0_g1~~TRINITY_DN232_c0_g1_i2.p2  ORF type:complete len:372 (-),score=105.61 TRINITY_DN232_c0_g1_i2:953-2068(-)
MHNSLNKMKDVHYKTMLLQSEPKARHSDIRDMLASTMLGARLKRGRGTRMSREDPSVGRELQQIDVLHEELNGEVDKMHKMMIAGVQNSQDDLLLAYKLEMQTVEKDYRKISQKIQEEQESYAIEKSINDVRQELQWFKSEALKLFKEHKEQAASIAKMKLQLGLLEEERDFHQDELEQSRKANKLAAMKVSQYKANFPQLYLTGLSSKKPQSAVRTEANNEQIEDWVNEELAEIGPSRTSRPANRNSSPSINSEKLNNLMNENKLLKEKEQELIGVIHKYRKQIDIIMKAEHQARGEKVRENMKNIELREFFVSCIEEAKKATVYRGSAVDKYQAIKPFTTKSKKRTTLAMEFRESQATDAKTSRESEKE